MISEQQQLVLLYVPTVCSCLSVLGSCHNVNDILQRMRTKKKCHVYHRLVLIMSIFDMLSSLSFSLANIPVPKGTHMALDAFGNDSTCTAQGFFNVLGISSPYYNTALAIYFLLKIRYGKREEWLRRYAEPFMHLVSYIMTFAIAITGLALQVFNFAGNRCFISGHPYGCQHNERITCERGGTVRAVRYMFYGDVVFLFLIVFCCMTSIFLYIYHTEKKSNRWHFPRSEAVFDDRERARRRSSIIQNYRSLKELKYSRKVARQALLYVSSFFLCYVWSYVFAVMSETGARPPYSIYVLFYTFYPLQGFFNFIIYKVSNGKSKPRSSDIETSGSRRLSFQNIRHIFLSNDKDTSRKVDIKAKTKRPSIAPSHVRVNRDKTTTLMPDRPERRESCKKPLSCEGAQMLAMIAATMDEIDDEDDTDLFIEELELNDQVRNEDKEFEASASVPDND